MSEIATIFIVLICVGTPWSIPLAFIVMNYRKRRRFIELHHAERMAAIERGMDVPPLPMELLGTPPSKRSALLPGLIWLLVGVALMVALRGVQASTGIGGLFVWGLIPTAVGVAYLIYYFAEGRKTTARATEGT